MIQWGISARSHDAAIAVIKDKTEIVFAAHSERYSRIKNDKDLNEEIVHEACLVGGQPDEVIWYERPHMKRLRHLKAGQYREAFDPMSTRMYLNQFGKDRFQDAPIHFVDHHESHAAAGYFTSGYNDAAVVVVDAIGEFDTVSVWQAEDNTLKKIFSETYPNSVGLMYSAMTKRVGLKPNEDEYILMGMAAYGHPTFDMHKYVNINNTPHFESLINFHKGVTDQFEPDQNVFNIAATTQNFTEQYLQKLVGWASRRVPSKNLVLMGGVALNCVANAHIAGCHFNNSIWIMPNPGDAGSSLGAVAAYNKQHLNWETPYLGTNIDRPFDHDGILSALLEGKIVGVANGRAEFGPRAFGNRSLLADPRGAGIKERVNSIKQRQQFRPFAPIILEEKMDEFFDMPIHGSPYMQFTATVLEPKRFPAISHVDGTARVQTLNEKDNPNMHRLLTAFYKATNCPMLLNTSLNIKGEPLVNTWDDAIRFQDKYGVPIF